MVENLLELNNWKLVKKEKIYNIKKLKSKKTIENEFSIYKYIIIIYNVYLYV